jgi:hypothetical protein
MMFEDWAHRCAPLRSACICRGVALLRLAFSIFNLLCGGLLGGQDWPKAIQALENAARSDKNRTGPYCCVFGIAMDRGSRYIKRAQKTKIAHSVNTEIWLSDYFWPFFVNYTYEEIMTLVLDVLISSYEANNLSTEVEIPDKLLDSFGEACIRAGLVDTSGNFDDPHKLVRFFVSSLIKKGTKKNESTRK